MKAIFNNKIIAQSDKTISFEGSTYFPPESIFEEYFELVTNYTTVCPIKGTATYYTIKVNGEIRDQAAWSYQNPTTEASIIKGYFAFWKGISIKE